MSKREINFIQTCSSCKLNCCLNARPPITEKRKKIIEDYLAAEDLIIDQPFSRTAYTFPRETGDGLCVFFDEENQKCLIHIVKPETCVAGPVTFDINLQTGKIEWFLKSERICLLASTLHKSRKELKNHLARAKKELKRLIREVGPDELFALIQIEEPDTFKIGEDTLKPETLKLLKASNASRLKKGDHEK